MGDWSLASNNWRAVFMPDEHTMLVRRREREELHLVLGPYEDLGACLWPVSSARHVPGSTASCVAPLR